jgi:Concanavalin A-like lectin/glucanases superfamily
MAATELRSVHRRGARVWVTWLLAASAIGPIAVLAQTPDLPPGAVAHYEFADAAGTTIPNRIQTASALPVLNLRGADFQVANGEGVWNQNIGNFTFSFPFNPSRGTFAEHATTFPNFFGSGGTLAVRLRLAPSVVTNLGQASSMGLITFRGDPDPNIHRVPPRALEFHRDGATDPLYFLVREGDNSIGHNNEFNDIVRSGPLTNLVAADMTAIVVWDAQTLRIYVNGVLGGTTARVTVDHPTPRYRVMVAVQPGLIHSGDNQFYKGAIRSFVVYNRVLSPADVATLHSALSGAVAPSPIPPSAPTNVRIVP